MILKPGIVISDHYQLVRELGTGQFGRVWLAHNMLANIDEAIKFYWTFGDMADGENGIEEFREEFKVTYRLNHPNLLHINHFDVHEGIPYLVMPYCPYGSAASKVGHFSETEAWRFLHDVSAGLAYLHQQHPHIVHQDIKPANILISDNGNYLISDFGISRHFRTQQSLQGNQNPISGTVAYMGPEHFTREPKVLTGSDIWSLGMTVYELLTGDVMWGGMGGVMQLNGAHFPLLDKVCSPKLAKLIYDCLALDPNSRPSAADICRITANSQDQNNELEDRKSAERHPIPTPKLSDNRGKIATHRPNLRRVLPVVAGLFVVCLLCGGIIKYIGNVHEQQMFLNCQTPEDYRHFLEKYPNSDKAEMARLKAGNSSTEEPNDGQQPSTEAVAATPPAPTAAPPRNLPLSRKHVSTAHTKKDNKPISQKQVITKENFTQNAAADDEFYYKCTDLDDFRAYLGFFPQGRHVAEAKQAIQHFAYQKKYAGKSSPQQRYEEEEVTIDPMPEQQTRQPQAEKEHRERNVYVDINPGRVINNISRITNRRHR